MTSEGLGEMFEGARKFPLVSMGGRAEGLACADPGASLKRYVTRLVYMIK